ncbi:hypothetical protein [Agromyces humi]|uniref:hypothetical protein n=1 Tax=Agromyces humi TaxID=1766800 RepID=UPI0013586EE3|nr:hypothetical protein [Agromyces humi]
MRLTQQEVDPIGGITAAPLVVIGAGLAFTTSVVLTVAHWSEVGSPWAALLAVALVTAAGLCAAFLAAPGRAPFRTESLWLVVALALGGAIAEYLSTIGANRFLYDDFGPIVVGMLILSLAPFCTWVSLLLSGVVATAVLSILIVGSPSTTVIAAPPLTLVAVESAAVLALTAAAAGYSWAIVAVTLTWQREANRAALQRDGELRAGIARSVQQSRVSVLGREVLPFLAGVMTADRISVADADRARELAEALRRALKAGIESTWLDDLGATIRMSRGIPVSVDDPTGASDDLADDQRSALTALLTWLSEGSRSAGIRVSIELEVSRRRLVITSANGATPPSRRELDRFIAVARAVSMRAEALVTRENVRVELSHVPG